MVWTGRGCDPLNPLYHKSDTRVYSQTTVSCCQTVEVCSNGQLGWMLISHKSLFTHRVHTLLGRIGTQLSSTSSSKLTVEHLYLPRLIGYHHIWMWVQHNLSPSYAVCIIDLSHTHYTASSRWTRTKKN